MLQEETRLGDGEMITKRRNVNRMRIDRGKPSKMYESNKSERAYGSGRDE